MRRAVCEPMPLIEEAHKAARTLLDHAYVRIVARPEADAACAAALLAHALRRENVDFHVSWAARLDETAIGALREERPDCLVSIGLSADATGELPAPRRILVDGSPPSFAADATVHDDASLASLAHLIAAGISRRNGDLAPLALAGAIAASRHVGGLRGLDAEVLHEALEARVMLREASLALHGASLVAALTQLDVPFVGGVTGRARNAKKLVADLGLSSEAPAMGLADDAAERLGSFLTLRLLQQNAPDAALDALFRPALRGLQGPHTGLECGELARVAEAACAAGRPGLAFAALWPDAAVAGEVADLMAAFREEVVAAMLRAERDGKREGRLFVAEAPRAALCGPLADRIAASLAPAECVTVVHAPEGDGAFLATRSFGPDAARSQAWAPDATHAIKALAEGST